MANISIAQLRKKKLNQQKITALTAYDATFARLFAKLGVDVMLVGDSLGNVLQGHDSTVPVTNDDIAYHTRCVRRGAPESFIIADMPFMTYSSPEQACEHAAVLMQAGANMVKLEGGEWLFDTVNALTTRGVPVCAHLGLLPQSVNVLGGYKVQGRDDEQANTLISHAKGLEHAGAQLLVVECIPTALGERVAQAVEMPVIGIGAGKNTDGQILVMHDMLGLNSDYLPKFVKNFLADSGSIEGAVQTFIDDVTTGAFPGPEHSFD
ncbi:3-methyl-2-oxobutanoate hydroxymethyltransferase [Aliidiomarina soli]|uniref:3-methyl-2-oxobutanoate hydroxymethyltransferase n=1 Tax=Aliidiomarina soli TaxID=1928574 RepID=A0A432WDR6_9GAMM|nr:3-methyl-2-oxobutanoate hydroxymethyltransferase [Aliidiomarina soli]RUO31023.1 3-methyl-2-oxobutanoate hydroxymethyltransferase [Aliidiomarina soli]